jgi:surface antigen
MSMSPFLRAAGVAALLAVAGCSTNDSSHYSQEPMLGTTPPPADYSGSMDTQTSAPPPAQVASTGVQNLDITGFTDPAGISLMSATDKAQAASAQYYALQFGRVGAARTWAGDKGHSGSISVGPFVKVNNNDCRDFTNIVNIDSRSYTKRGTACRGFDGGWTVGTAAASAPAYPPATTAAPVAMGTGG